MNGVGQLSRRKFLASSTALATTTGALSGVAISQQKDESARGVSDRSKSDPGLTNQALDAQNPSSIATPVTDAGSVPAFEYPFSLAHKRLYEGGWSREVTVRELPISRSIAGVNMRLTVGGISELHWHAAAEWAFMLYGSARITAIDVNGRSFVADVSNGDRRYFPTGIPHSIQGLGRDGAEFLLVFDDGNFSEYATVLLSDRMASTPREVLAKNFGTTSQELPDLAVAESTSAGPSHEHLKMFEGSSAT